MEGLVVFKEPMGAVTEAYRVLCANLMATLEEKNVLEVTGVADNGNASTVVANLAIAIAQTGKNVLIIDCNLRVAKQSELFGLQKRGLVECVTTGEHYTSFVQSTKQNNLFVLAAGTIVGNPLEILLSKTIEYILQEAKETYDIVLLDVPPVVTISDAIALGTKTDGVLLILTNKQDKVEQAQKAKEMFAQIGVTVLGCVLVKA